MKKKKKKKDLEDIFEAILSVMAGFTLLWPFLIVIFLFVNGIFEIISEDSIIFNPYFFGE